MMQSQREVLLREIAHVTEQQSRHEVGSFFHIAHGGRLVALQNRLAVLEQPEREPARVAVTFNGSSVDGSASIGIKLFTRTMTAFKDIVGLIRGSQEGLTPTAGGRPRSAKTEDLHFTNIALGSFGYELAVRHPDGLWSEQATGQAINEAMDLLQAAGNDEEAFLAAVEERPPQLFGKLKAFVGPVKRDNGSIRLVTDERTLVLDRDQVVLAYERITQTVTDEYTETLRGTFQGVLTGSRRFEFAPSDSEYSTLSGTVDEDLDDERLVAFDRNFVNQEVRATFRVLVVTPRGGVERRSWVLLDVRVTSIKMS